jgi:hypothetical protein
VNLATSFPVLYTVLGLGRVSVPAAAVGVPGQVGPVVFRFPAVREVTDLLVLAEDGTPESLAALSLEILDQHNDQAFSDQLGDTRAPRLPFAFPCESMVGRKLRPFPLLRFVKNGSVWRLTLKNSSGAPVRVASVSIGIREVQ